MQSKRAVTCICSVAALMVLSLPPGGAHEDLHDKLVRAYNNGDYARALQFGQEELKNEPSNTVARYYLAETLVRLNRRDEAIQQFAQCAAQSKDAKLIGYCRQALAALHGQHYQGDGGASSQSHVPLGQRRAVQGNASAAAVDSEEPKDLGLLQRKADVLQEGVKEIEFLRKQADKRIADINQDVAEQMRDVPPFFERAVGYRGRILRVPNPDYEPISERVKSEAKKKIDDINADFSKREAEITAEYKRRAQAYSDVETSMTSQQKAGPGLIQMTPRNTNPFVRNFVNYDGSGPEPPPIPLKATPAGLNSDKKSK